MKLTPYQEAVRGTFLRTARGNWYSRRSWGHTGFLVRRAGVRAAPILWRESFDRLAKEPGAQVFKGHYKESVKI